MTRGSWDKEGKLPPTWYTKEHSGADGVKDTMHGEPVKKITIDEVMDGSHEADSIKNELNQDRYEHHLVLVKLADLMDEEMRKALRKIGIRSPGWYRWRVLYKANGDIPANIESELLVSIRGLEDYKAGDVPGGDDDPTIVAFMLEVDENGEPVFRDPETNEITSKEAGGQQQIVLKEVLSDKDDTTIPDENAIIVY